MRPPSVPGAAMTEILTPRCPLCDSPPAIMLPGATQAFCGNDDCTLLMWTRTKSLDENLMGAGVVKLPPMEGGGDD
jgi:hypothetical protein